MKKVLLGSTALLGAAALFAAPASAEMETTFSGFLKAEFWGASQDDESDGDRDYVFGVDDSEFHIKAKNTADNGLSYGVTLEMEIADTVTMDEGYLWFSGDDWGRLELGGNDGATSTMPYSGDFSLTAAFGYDGGLSNIYNFAKGGITSPDLAGDTGDAAKINYYSPRFSGIQVGITYLPDSGQATIGSDTEDSDSSNGSSWIVLQKDDPDTGDSAGDVVLRSNPSDDEDEDIFQIGVNFVDSFNGVDVGIGGAYTTSSPEDGSTVGRDDTEGYHVGFNLGFSGFTFGASYADNMDSGCSVAGCDGGIFYEVAGSYATGPFTISAGWFHSEKDIDTTSDQETDIISVGAKYSLAPGAVIITELNFVDESGATDQDGTTYMVGTQISF